MALESAGAEAGAVRPALTVSALNRAVAGLLERGFPSVRVQGEVCNLTRAASGHWYFSLKDDTAQVRCVMFRSRNALLDWMPRDGDDVEANAVVSLYQARGEFQLVIESLQRAGLGRLYEEFLRLKQRLAAEGLFDAPRRSLPRVPQAVGVVTSLQAAALRDVLITLTRRAPYLRVVVYPVPVQGAGAGAQIAAMLACAGARAEVDALLLVRGGGSIEDLWAFNEEAVARALRACPLPVIVGVGHESDVTIADFVADARAATPTAAAELVAPSVESLRAMLDAQWRHLARPLGTRLAACSQRVDYALRSLAAPRAPVAGLAGRVATLAARATGAVRRAHGDRAQRSAALLARWQRTRPTLPSADAAARRLVAAARAAQAQREARCSALAGRLTALNPHAVLDRGYAIALDARGRAVTAASSLAAGDALRLVLARGAADVTVQATHGIDAAGGEEPGR